MVPIGANRMIHQSTFCTMDSSEALNVRNGSADLPTFSAAIPIAIDTTINCRMLKSRPVTTSVTPPEPSVWTSDSASRLRMFCGTSPVRKAHQSPVDDGAPASDSRSEEHTSELQSRGHLVCRLLLEK